MLICVVALAMVVAACSSSESVEPVETSAPSTTTAAPATTDAPTPTASPPTTAAPDTTVAPSDVVVVGVASTDLGDILTDDAGFTLYLFMPDQQGASACYDQCEAAWPPLVAATTAGQGLDAGLLSDVSRTNGASQVTYNGWPLYYFSNDLVAGETNGQGVNEVWYVVDANGEPIR